MGMREVSTTDGASDRINIAASWELNYWTTRWGVTQDELIRAVAEVGTNVRVVQAYLGRAGRQSNPAIASSQSPPRP